MNSEEHLRVIKGAIQKINTSEDLSQNDITNKGLSHLCKYLA